MFRRRKNQELPSEYAKEGRVGTSRESVTKSSWRVIVVLMTSILCLCAVGRPWLKILLRKTFRVLDREATARSAAKNVLPLPISQGVDGAPGIVAIRTQNRGTDFSILLYDQNDIVSTSIINHKVWDLDNVKAFNQAFLRYSKEKNVPLSELVFVDIGANVGWFSLCMAALGVQVHAFEPMPENAALMQKSLELQDNIRAGISSRITLHPHGLGPKEEVCLIYSGDDNYGDGVVECVENEEDYKPPTNYSVRDRVQLKRLDDVMDVKDMHLVAIKMDVEGFESHVLEGGTNVFLNGGAELIVCEFIEKWIASTGGDPVRFMKRFADAGYRVQRSKNSVDQGSTKIDSTEDRFMTGDEMIQAAKLGLFGKLNDIKLHRRKDLV